MVQVEFQALVLISVVLMSQVEAVVLVPVPVLAQILVQILFLEMKVSG